MVEDNDSLAEARAKVEQMDKEIAALLKERAVASNKVQEIRLSQGGVRVSLSQEGIVRARWSDLLGSRETGNLAAELVLLMGRGHLNARAYE